MESVMFLFLQRVFYLFLALIPPFAVAEIINTFFEEKVSNKLRAKIIILSIICVEIVFQLEVTFLPRINEVISIQSAGIDGYTWYFMSWVALIEETMKIVFALLAISITKIKIEKKKLYEGSGFILAWQDLQESEGVSLPSDKIETFQKTKIPTSQRKNSWNNYTLTIVPAENKVYSIMGIMAGFAGVEHMYHMLRVPLDQAFNILISRTTTGTQNVHLMTGLFMIFILMLHDHFKNKKITIPAFGIACYLVWLNHVIFNTLVFTAVYGVRSDEDASRYIWLVFFVMTIIFIVITDPDIKKKLRKTHGIKEQSQVIDIHSHPKTFLPTLDDLKLFLTQPNLEITIISNYSEDEYYGLYSFILEKNSLSKKEYIEDKFIEEYKTLMTGIEMVSETVIESHSFINYDNAGEIIHLQFNHKILYEIRALEKLGKQYGFDIKIRSL